jgi:transcriptional regulator with XRE-family HTH domain
MSTTKLSEAKRGRKISKDHRLLDAAKKKFAIESDAALAAWLGITKQEIYAVRATNRALGLVPRLRLLDHIAFQEGVHFIADIADESLADKFLTWSRKKANLQAKARMAHVNWNEAKVAILDALKVITNRKTDADLAELLELKPNTISMIRTGRNGLGERPRIKILALLLKEIDGTDFDHKRFAETIDDPEKIAEAIDNYRSEVQEHFVCPNAQLVL